ncbi:carbohydrate ABC transporter permease [Yoonia sp.]|uniref:carbohydrate ABC transporter permease n=1 Tax=Yoonia sp. TaxID=2212373 RepID=UPI0040483C76
MTQPRARTGNQRREMLRPYAFFLPAFVIVAIVSIVPLLQALYQSLYRSDYLALGDFVGLQNFPDYLAFGNGWRVVWNSLIFTGGTLLFAVPLGFVLAFALNQKLPFIGFFRTILILPWLISNIVTAMLWAWLLNGAFSPLGPIAAFMGYDMPNAVSSLSWAMPALIICNVWNCFPLVMVFVLAALQTVPSDLLEAAKLDGAPAWRRFRYIVFPLIKNTTLVAIVLTTLNTFNNITLIFVLTGGGPVGKTETLAFRVFQLAFRDYQMGLATAGAVIIFALNVAFTLAYIRVLKPAGAKQ